MDKKLRETTNMEVEIMNSQRCKEGIWSQLNSLLPFDVNMMLNLSTCRVRLHTLLHAVACCWELLHKV